MSAQGPELQLERFGSASVMLAEEIERGSQRKRGPCAWGICG